MPKHNKLEEGMAPMGDAEETKPEEKPVEVPQPEIPADMELPVEEPVLPPPPKVVRYEKKLVVKMVPSAVSHPAKLWDLVLEDGTTCRLAESEMLANDIPVPQLEV